MTAARHLAAVLAADSHAHNYAHDHDRHRKAEGVRGRPAGQRREEEHNG